MKSGRYGLKADEVAATFSDSNKLETAEMIFFNAKQNKLKGDLESCYISLVSLEMRTPNFVHRFNFVARSHLLACLPTVRAATDLKQIQTQLI
jgi:hypothetical protein